MTLWTISTEPGTPGDRIGAALADAAGVPFYDRTGLAELARSRQIEVPALNGLEERFCSRSSHLLSLATGAGASEALAETQLRRALPELGRLVVREAARSSAVIAVPAAFAVLADHPAAVHTRIRGPFAWRAAAFGREELVDLHHAEKAVRHADSLSHAWVRMLYHLDADDDSRYTLSLDASRLPEDRIVEILLAAAGVRRTERQMEAA